MWQRLQTLLLGIATALTGAMLFCRFATIIGPEGSETTIGYHEKVPYLVMLIMMSTAQVIATASFKSLFLQARVSVIAGLLAVGFQIWLATDVLRNLDTMTFSITVLFPMVAAFLDFVAARQSMIDAMTVQAVRSARRARRRHL